jgi:hypothetical protein
MYEVRDYLTDELVAVCSRKVDAVAMIRTGLDSQKLIVKKVKKDLKKG